MKTYKLALVGATGLVGRTAIKVLEEKNLPISEYVFFASKQSAGTTVHLLGKDYIVQELTEDSFDYGFDFAIFSAGGDTAKKFAPIAASKGCIVVDNSSAFRMDEDVPLVVPEVNPDDLINHKNIIANPNCSTIQAVVPLKPLDDKYKIKRIVYSTYQAVSGAGKHGVEDLENTLKGLGPKKFPYPIANNCLPHIDVFMDNGYTKEEILLVVNHLNEKDYKLLIKKYGRDLTNTKHVDDLTYQEEQDINTRIIYNIRRALKRIREGENYYCISTLLNTDINLIKERVHKLSIKERKILFRLFGENLDKEVLINPKQINRIISKVVVQKLTSSSKRSKPKKITPFYKRLIMCKRENETAEDFIKRVNLCISSKHLIILTKKYGSDLLNFIENENCTVEENEIITKIIIPTIKSRLRVLENKTLKEYLPYFVTMEDICEGIVELDIKEREKLYFEFGENLDQRRYFVDYREENNLKTMNIIKKLENIIYKNINKRMHIRTTTRESIKVLKNIKSLTQCEEFEFLLSLYPFNVSIAIIIKLNIEDFDNRQISLLTGVEENKITELTLSYLDEQSFLLQNNKRNLFKKTK